MAESFERQKLALFKHVKLLKFEHSIPKKTMQRIVREITRDLYQDQFKGSMICPFKWQVAAIEALHEASEGFLVDLFDSSKVVTQHCHRKTTFPQDIQLASRLRSRHL